MTAEALPPGPGPIPFNLLGWTLRPVPFMERCRARYGDRFTVDLGPPEGKWIFLGRRSITLSPRRGTPISVQQRVREPQPALSA